MSDEVVIEVSGDTIGRSAGEICVELLRQIQCVDDEGNVVDTQLDQIALLAHRLAIIACSGVRPEVPKT